MNAHRGAPSGGGGGGGEAAMTYSLPNLYSAPSPTARPSKPKTPRQQHTDTTLALLVRDRKDHPAMPPARSPPVDDVTFNTMRYPDRRALYLLGQSANDTAAHKWLNKLIARREQRNAHFLDRIKMRQQAEQTTSYNASPVRTPHYMSRNQCKNQPPHRYATSLEPPRNTPATKSRPPPTPRTNYPMTPKSRQGNISNAGWFNTEQFLSQSTGVLPNLSSMYQPTSSRGKRTTSQEITVDLTKENTSNIAHRLLGAYVEKSPNTVTRTFMNIGEAPTSFVDQYLQDRILEKMDHKAICNHWLRNLNPDWEIVEDTNSIGDEGSD